MQFTIMGDQSGSIVNAAFGGRGRGGRGKMLCTKCGKTNHTVERCFEIIGFPPGFGRGRDRPQKGGNGGSGNTTRCVNQVSAVGDATYDNTDALIPPQMAQMLQYLQAQLQQQAQIQQSQTNFNAKETSTSGSSCASSSFSGSFSGNYDWQGWEDLKVICSRCLSICFKFFHIS